MIEKESIEPPRASFLCQFQAPLIGAEQHLLAKAALAVLVVDRERIVTHGLDTDHPDDLVAFNASDLAVLFDVFKFQHEACSVSAIGRSE